MRKKLLVTPWRRKLGDIECRSCASHAIPRSSVGLVRDAVGLSGGYTPMVTSSLREKATSTFSLLAVRNLQHASVSMEAIIYPPSRFFGWEPKSPISMRHLNL